MKTKNAITAVAALYLAATVATFGNAAVFFERRGQANVSRCEATAKDDMKALCSWQEASGIAASVSALAWPFYWSYRLAQ